MINGLGVLGWGVGGIEAEAAMLGEALSMLVPQVVGFQLTGELPEGATATDLVLTVTEILRKTGVVGKFVEYFGHGPRRAPARRPRDDREHVAGVRRDLRLLPGRRRDAPLPAADRPQPRSGSRSSRPTARRTCSGTSPRTSRPTRRSSSSTSSTVEPSLAGPRRPQDRVPLSEAKQSFLEALGTFGVDYGNEGYDKEVADSFPASDPPTGTEPHGDRAASATGRRPEPPPRAVTRGRRRSSSTTARS